MMLLLFVEDDDKSIRQVLNKVKAEHSDIECEVKGFEEAIEWIERHSPDIVSLDLFAGLASLEADVVGQEIYELIWKHHFCPIIVYSAQPDAHEEQRPSHPFLTTIKKGKGSPDRFSEAVNGFRPHVDALREAEAQVRREFVIAMRDLAPDVFEQVEDVRRAAEFSLPPIVV